LHQSIELALAQGSASQSQFTPLLSVERPQALSVKGCATHRDQVESVPLKASRTPSSGLVLSNLLSQKPVNFSLPSENHKGFHRQKLKKKKKKKEWPKDDIPNKFAKPNLKYQVPGALSNAHADVKKVKSDDEAKERVDIMRGDPKKVDKLY